MKNLKILELTNYTSGICGVWQRVKEESIRLRKLGFKVKIFSSNIEKGTNKIVPAKDYCDEVEITRFPAKKLGGESYMKWNFEKEALNYSPDIIIAHNYRHPHTASALKIAEKLRKQGKQCRVFLVTHAPFVPDNSTRSILSALIVNFYDRFMGNKILNRFDKVLTISKWEEEFLYKIGLEKSKIAYIPNGIPEEFFSLKNKSKEENKILFLGRISPIKNLEVLIKAMSIIKDKKIILEIVGPPEESYKIALKKLIHQLSLDKRVVFSNPIYDLKEKITKIDSCRIFVLPSKKEGLPQSLIEAMSREKIVLASDIPASKDIIFDGKNGFIFKSNDENNLAFKLDNILNLKNSSELKKKARLSVINFSWEKIIKKLTKLF